MLEDDPGQGFASISDFQAALRDALELAQTTLEPIDWPVGLVPPAIQVTEDVTDPILAVEQTIPFNPQEAVEELEIRDQAVNESGTMTDPPNALGPSGIVPVLPCIPPPPNEWAARETGPSGSSVSAGMRRPEGSLSKHNAVDLREQIVIRDARDASEHWTGGQLKLTQVDQGSGIGRVLFLAAGLVVLISALVLIANQRWTGNRTNNSSLDIEQLSGGATMASQPRTPNQSDGRQNGEVRPEKPLSDQVAIEGHRASTRAATHITRQSSRRPFKRHRRVQSGGYAGARAGPYRRHSGYYQ